MFNANHFKQKPSQFFAKPAKAEQAPDTTQSTILEKLEAICSKLASNDEIVSEFKKKQDELFTAFEKREPYFPTVSSTALAQPSETPQPLPPQARPESDKKKKKSYKKLTPDLIENVKKMYPQMPDAVSEFYTTDGEDLYALQKNKKVKIENLASVLSLIK